MQSSVGKSIMLIKMFFMARHFSPPWISGSSRLSSPSRVRGERSGGCRQGRIPQAFGLCNSLLDIYSFVFIYTQVLWGPTLFAPVHPPLEPIPLLTDSLNDATAAETQNPLPPSSRWERKKINGRIRMNFINWIARRAPRFDAARTTLCKCGVTCCNRLLRAPLPPLPPGVKWKKKTYQPPIAFYSLSPFWWLWLEMNFYIGLFIMHAIRIAVSYAHVIV